MFKAREHVSNQTVCMWIFIFCDIKYAFKFLESSGISIILISSVNAF